MGEPLVKEITTPGGMLFTFLHLGLEFGATFRELGMRVFFGSSPTWAKARGFVIEVRKQAERKVKGLG